MIDLKSMVLPEMEEYFRSLNLPRFRSKQVFSWLHEKRAASFDEMTNLPLSLRQQLAEQCALTTLVIERKLVSQLDGTIKYLYRLPDGNHIESVLMRYEHGNSLCISSQVGCKMGCAFCASTKAGFVRNLTPSEILEQVYMAGRDTGEKVSNIVMMGIGEPLDNYDNVLRFLELVSDPNGLNLSHRHISLSTCGVVDKIYDLADRSEIMPINRRWGIKELLDACRYYTDKTHRRISYEYALIAGVNDSRKQAEELAALLKGMLCHINLIPVNYVREAATVRRTLGADINAACGQLRREAEEPGRE